MSGDPKSKGNSSSTTIVLWFRNDLRLHDNIIIHEAAQRVQSGIASQVLPVFCFDPRWFHASSWGGGLLKTGPFRAQFVLESVLDLKDRLRGIGSDLLIAMGPPEDIIPPLAAGGCVLAQAEVTSEERGAESAVRRGLKRIGDGRLELHWGSTLYHLDDLPFHTGVRDMPDVFTPFKQKCEMGSTVRRCLPTVAHSALPLPSVSGMIDPAAFAFRPEKVEDLNSIVPEGHPKLVSPRIEAQRAAFIFIGGETAALERLKYYLWDSDLVATYFDIRNGMLGGDYSTKLSPALAHGCISPRKIHEEIRRYESCRTANKSTYWVIFELIWRDYFKFYALKHGNAIFKEHGPAGKRLVSSGMESWRHNPELLARWKEGRTGWPLVDANMRELVATGWMSNRGRQNVASFLTLNLGLNWRLGADWFESLLLDHDPASNYGNWVASAGLTGGRVNKFNITKQSKDYDGDGEYIRHWCPELSKVPASRIHEPWLMSKSEQQQYGVCIGIDYPQAIPSSSFVGRGDHEGGGRGDGGDQRASYQPQRYSNGAAKHHGGGTKGPHRAGGNQRKEFKARSAFDLYG